MRLSAINTLALTCVLCATAACSQPSGTAAPPGNTAAATPASDTTTTTAAIDGKAFCAKLQPAIQPLVRVPLKLYKASDSITEKEMHMGENDFVDCDFRQRQTQIDVSLHDDSDHALFDDPNAKGYAPLAGFADKARSASAMGEHWVDVVRGSIACEARLGLAEDGQVVGDWEHVAAGMCVAAFAAR